MIFIVIFIVLSIFLSWITYDRYNTTVNQVTSCFFSLVISFVLFCVCPNGCYLEQEKIETIKVNDKSEIFLYGNKICYYEEINNSYEIQEIQNPVIIYTKTKTVKIVRFNSMLSSIWLGANTSIDTFNVISLPENYKLQ